MPCQCEPGKDSYEEWYVCSNCYGLYEEAWVKRLRAQKSELLGALQHGQTLATRLLTEQVGLPSWMLVMIQGFNEEARAAIAAAEEEVQ